MSTLGLLTAGICTTLAVLFLYVSVLRIRACSSEPVAARHHRLLQAAPSLLTGLGVFGTFLGICLGLMQFDVANIDASVPMLLDGLKVAFITSVLGLALSLLYRLFGSALPLAAGGGDIQATFTSIREELQLQTQALVGDGDQSLPTIFGKLRNDLKDGFADQRKAFEEFAQTMAENNSKALIEALEEVIRDFNTQLNEQFGENFVRLNEAVGKLLEWQERYRIYLDDAQTKLDRVMDALDASSNSLASVAQSTAPLPDAMTALKATVAETREQIGVLDGVLVGVAALRERAEGAFPLIEQNLDRVTEGLRAGAEAHSKVMADAVEAAAKEMANGAERQSEALDSAADKVASNAEAAISRMQDTMESQFSKFDDQMQSELERALQLMGNQLASMSGTFADDYRGFSEQIARLTQSARRASSVREDATEFDHNFEAAE